MPVRLAVHGQSNHDHASREHAHAIAVAPADEAEAIVFDFVCPLRPERHRMAERRQAGLDKADGAASVPPRSVSAIAS